MIHFLTDLGGVSRALGSVTIDRRLNGKNKSVGDRERFLRRHKGQIREAVEKAVNKRNIRDIEKGEEIRIPKKDISEPTFHHSHDGIWERVHPGNREYEVGDRIERPPGGSGSGREASDSGEGDDDFVFNLTMEEFMKVFFDDMALPNLMRTTLTNTPEWRYHRAGIVTDGTPTNLHLVRSMRNKIGRAIAWGKPTAKKEYDELARRLAILEALRPEHDWEAEVLAAEIAETKEWLADLEIRINKVHLDPHDLRYRGHVRVPVPISKAVMFCLMDVSGSMDEARKELAKRFFILLYLFLTRHYDKIEVVFIRHHTQAKEVDEQNFFHGTETGGTVVSSALILMEEIIRARFPSSEWNIYGAQASDGDNWHHDSGRCGELLRDVILPLCRYYAYIQVGEEKEQELWDQYAKIAAGNRSFAMRKVLEQTEVYPVLHDLFKKEGANAFME